ncbi:MAG: phosphoribosyltransferase [Rhabdochlamydiaceae bacterium]|nr:phosphoribosyltransferase [Rhabdochlamydiaceae bacterium]
MIFKDRLDAGRQLAKELIAFSDSKNVIVIGLARGGVILAAEIAAALHLPMDIIVVRKIGAPGNEELALGAICESGEGVFNESLVSFLGVSQEYLEKEVERQRILINERLALYRGHGCPLSVQDKTVILVDDGIATGASIRVAIQSLRSLRVKKLVLAVPVAAPDSLQKIEKEVDRVVCLYRPSFFESVGSFYEVFNQTTDAEIVTLAKRNYSN